jgi:hypothetical protein
VHLHDDQVGLLPGLLDDGPRVVEIVLVVGPRLPG